MSQVIFSTINPATTSGNQLAQILNDFKDAVVSGLSGTSRPTNIQAGGSWVDTTNNPTSWDVKFYTGSVDITLLTVNLATGTATITNADSFFQILRTSEDSVGPILRLQKKRVTGGGQTKDGDTVGEQQFYGTRDTGVAAAQARIRVISTDDVTAGAAGSYMVFELASDGQTSLQEAMRLVDTKAGFGITPEEKVHVLGNLKAETQVDSTVGPVLKLRKRRVSGSGQVLTSDVIGDSSFYSTLDDGSEAEVARIRVTATQAHTAANQGSRVSWSYKRLSQNTFTEEMFLDDTGVNINRLLVTNLYATNAEFGTVVETEDAKIVLNKGGTQAGAQAAQAGIEVQMTDATYAQLAYDSTLTSKWKIGLAADLREVVTVSHAQNLTNKTLTGATVVTPARLDLKQDTEANLTTYALTASNGQICFSTDTKVAYQVIDTQLVPLGAGGGGVSLNWKANTNAPLDEFIDGFDLKSFDSVSSQEIYATLTVPASYRPGKQIRIINAQFFCNVVSGNVFFKTQATLISSTTVLGTYTNQRTSTNSQVTVSGTLNRINSIGILDLTSTTGQINGVSVAPGDKIRVRLYRDNAAETSSATADARLLIDGLEPTFS